MRVDEPVDHVEFSAALERIVMKAMENDCDKHEILRELESYMEEIEENKRKRRKIFDWRSDSYEQSEDSYESDELRDRTGDSNN